MRIYHKTLLALMAGFLLMLFLLFILVKLIVIEEYQELERTEVTANLDRIKNAYIKDRDELLRLNIDWATRHDTFDYINGKSNNYIVENITPKVFKHLDVSDILFFKSNGQLYSGFTLADEQIVTDKIKIELLQLIQEFLSLHKAKERNVAGVVVLEESSYLLAMSRISAADNPNKEAGLLVMIRPFQKMAESIAQRTKLPVQMINIKVDDIPFTTVEIVNLLSYQQAKIVRIVNDTQVEGFILLYDINDYPGIILNLSLPRALYMQGMKSIHLFLIYIIISGLVALAMLSYFFDKIILKRLSTLSERLTSLQLDSTNIQRLPIEGHDEITNVSSSVNNMLTSIEQGFQRKRLYESRQLIENQILVQLAKDSDINQGLLFEAGSKITSVLSYAVSCDRSSLWLYNQDKSHLICYHVYDSLSNSRGGGYIVSAQEHLQFLVKIQEDKCYMAEPDERITPLQEQLLSFERDKVAKSSIYFPIYNTEGFAGVLMVESLLCHYQWRSDEIIFLISVGEFVSHALAIKNRKQKERQLEFKANYDALTDLANRELFCMELNKAAEEIMPGREVALFYIDLDKFKPINDTYGHEYGDLVLVEVAKGLESCVRATDTVARLGGDEFAIILCNLKDAETAMIIAKKILSTCCGVKSFNGKNIEIALSIGIALMPEHTDSIDDLVRFADEAMYRSKSQGTNQIRIYNVPDIDTAFNQS